MKNLHLKNQNKGRKEDGAKNLGMREAESTALIQEKTRQSIKKVIDTREHVRYELKNKPSGKSLIIKLEQQEHTMPPSFSTKTLLENMDIREGETVLDLGAGMGIVAITAKVLGAKEVTALELIFEATEEIQINIKANEQSNIEIIIGDMFKPISGRRFDHIIVNPPSIPSLPKHKLSSAYNSGSEGRLIHDVVQSLAMYYLTANGRLTLVHGSLCNLDLSITKLQELGYKLKVDGPFEHEFREWYPVKYIEELARQGKAKFSVRNGKYYEQRFIITATMEQAKKTRVMEYLDKEDVSYRMLPHTRETKTCELAAKETGVPLDEIVKSILLKDKKGRMVLICLTGDANLDPKKIKEYLESYSRLSFASAEDIINVFGYEMGSVAPIDLKIQIPVILDIAIQTKDKVNISSGVSSLGLELKTEDFIKCVPGAIFCNIKKV